MLLLVVWALSARGPSPSVAGISSISIGKGGLDGEVWGGFVYSSPLSGGEATLTPSAQCETGLQVVQFASWAIEFPLASMPADAAITSASLALRVQSAYPEFAEHSLFAHAGDGVITADDVEPGVDPVLFTPTTTAARESWDVTALLSPETLEAGWVAFSVHRVDYGHWIWDCPDGELYPVLTIQYSLPGPSSSPQAIHSPQPMVTAAPLPTAPGPAAVPDTATEPVP